jgi:ribonuclease R
VVATVGRRGRFQVAEPVFERATPLRLDGHRAREGSLVLVGPGKRGARVVRELGRPEVARDVLEGLMLDRGLRRAFPRRAEAEAGDDPVDGGSRADLTDLPTFTIDPPDARDFDDAISARREGDRVRLWVHIADVTAYVRPGTAVDKEAVRRGTSVYVPGAVEPMLPEELSNRKCSLRPGETRLAVTVEMEIRGTDVLSQRFLRSTVRSDARLTYPQVDAVFAGTERAEEPWAEPLAAARQVSAALRALRDRRGSLAVNSAEPRFAFDRAGHVTAVGHEEQTESHRLIEELMVLANERVAGHLADSRTPALYRVHERPEPQSVEFMVEQLASLDVPTPPIPERMSPQQAADVAAEASHLVADYVERNGRGRSAFGALVLRSLKQAYYTPRNLGHAGLASPRYCHFTSPIRRLPDIAVHRALLAHLGLDDAGPRAHELEEQGVEASAREREAMTIERDADDVCLAFLLERTLSEHGPGARFEGEVVGLIAKGAFVRFGEEGFEGFLPVRRLRGWWELNELGTALEAENGGRLRFGDTVEVEVDRVESPRGRVDLAPT